MYIKNPGEDNKLGYGYKGNKALYEAVERSLHNNRYIMNAFQWSDSPEGTEFWKQYYFGNESKKQMSRLREILKILSPPTKPFNKEDWL